MLAEYRCRAVERTNFVGLNLDVVYKRHHLHVTSDLITTVCNMCLVAPSFFF